MKAALWYARKDIRIETVPDPGPPGPGEVILKVSSCGICGTDLEEYLSGPIFMPVDKPNPLTGDQVPLILGHEFAGEVVEVGRDVPYKPGDRLAPDTLIPCGECYYCQRHELSLCDNLAILGLMAHGGLAEYCKVPIAMCIEVPQGLSLEYAALAEPLSVAVRAVRKSRLRIGETVAIFGGGTIGLFCLQIAVSAGASAVYMVEPVAQRRALALELGATGVIDPKATDVVEELRRLTKIGPDVVLEACGVPEVTPTTIAAARKAGRIVLIGIPGSKSTFNFLDVVVTEKEVIGSFSHVYDEDFSTALSLIAEGRIHAEKLITHRIPLDRLVEDGLHRLENHPLDTLKILVKPHELANV
jgi:(R,R)-butanediol dehydrogenase/meso-butanediol dehydrogenase/diacetyl reductase